MQKLTVIAAILTSLTSLTACHADPSTGDVWVYEGTWGTYTNIVDWAGGGYVLFHNPTAPEHRDVLPASDFKKYCTRRAGEPQVITGDDGMKYTVVIIDGCQYLKYSSSANATMLCHKGNCVNAVHTAISLK